MQPEHLPKPENRPASCFSGKMGTRQAEAVKQRFCRVIIGFPNKSALNPTSPSLHFFGLLSPTLVT
jgi:hypothetical protein